MSDPIATAPATAAAPATTPAAAPAAVIPSGDPATAPAPATAVAAPSAAGLLTDPAAAAPDTPKTLTLPKDGDTEGWGKLFDDLGAPKDASGYDIPVPEGGDPGLAKFAAGAFAKARLTSNQAQIVQTEWNTEMARIAEVNAQAARDAETARGAQAQREEAELKNAWGAMNDKNLGLSKQAVREFIEPFVGAKAAAGINALEREWGYGAVVKIMHAIGARVGEPSPRGLGDTPVPKAPGLEDTMRASLNSALGRA